MITVWVNGRARAMTPEPYAQWLRRQAAVRKVRHDRTPMPHREREVCADGGEEVEAEAHRA